jgi:hypothetical protein
MWWLRKGRDMNRLLFMMGLLLILIIPQALASTTQDSSAYRQTMWNNITDSMHTLGQSPQQAKWTKKRLHNARTQTRLRNISKARRQAWLNSQN